MPAPARYVDGDILTAGSLNNSLNVLPNLGVVSVSLGSVTGSGTQLTVKDFYVSSGALQSSASLLYVQWNGQYFEPDATAVSGIVSIGIGPSGTSPTLTTIGSSLVYATFTQQSLNNFTQLGIGSTTLDNATVPALVRLRSAQVGGTAYVMGVSIFGVGSLAIQ